jgi:hypothetical protein
MAIVYNTSIVRSGLVVHLDAANPKSYPGSGTAWRDLSGSKLDGTLSNVTYSSANNGSLTFDDANDTVSVAHSSVLNFGGVFTVSAWIKVNSFNASLIYNVISKKPSFNNTQKGWSCQYDYRTTGVLQFRNNDGTTLNDSTPTSSINNTSLLNQTTAWVNSVWVISGVNVYFYINGDAKQNSTVNYTNTDTTNTIYIGKTVGSSGDLSLLMNISDTKIYNRALNPLEVRQNFEALRGRYGI